MSGSQVRGRRWVGLLLVQTCLSPGGGSASIGGHPGVPSGGPLTPVVVQIAFF